MATVEGTSSSAGIDRQLPQNLEAERSVLGSILLLPEVFDEVAIILRPEDFYDDSNRCIYQHLLEMHNDGKQIDALLLRERLLKAGKYESVGGAAYLAELGEQVSTAAHAEYYAHIVSDKSVVRSLIHAGTDIVHDAYEPSREPREVLSRAEERIFSVLESRDYGAPATISEVLLEAMERIEARIDHTTPSGLLTGFIDLDKIIGGLQNSELSVLAARPSMGKTSLAMNIAEHVAMNKEAPAPVLFVSLEMSAVELGDRLLCSYARIDGYRLRNGILKPEELKKLAHESAELSRAPIFIDDSPSRTVTEIGANARRLKRREDLRLVIIDYLQLIEPDRHGDPRQEQVAKIARRLKGLARELSIPVLCLAQLNRQVETRHDNMPQLSHLRESGAIEQDADVVMFVHREEPYLQNEEDKERVRGEASVLVRKNRNGRIGDVTLTWKKEFTRFENNAPEPYPHFPQPPEIEYHDSW